MTLVANNVPEKGVIYTEPNKNSTSCFRFFKFKWKKSKSNKGEEVEESDCCILDVIQNKQNNECTVEDEEEKKEQQQQCNCNSPTLENKINKNELRVKDHLIPKGKNIDFKFKKSPNYGVGILIQSTDTECKRLQNYLESKKLQNLDSSVIKPLVSDNSEEPTALATVTQQSATQQSATQQSATQQSATQQSATQQSGTQTNHTKKTRSTNSKSQPSSVQIRNSKARLSQRRNSYLKNLQTKVENKLKMDGITYVNLKKTITNNENRPAAAPEIEANESPKNMFGKLVEYLSTFFLRPKKEMTWDAYHDLDTIKDFLYDMEKKYPTLVSVRVIGRTCQNRSIRVLKISNRPKHTGDIIFIEAGIHAREWVSPATATYIINTLLIDWPYLPQYLKNITWIFLPVTNPDGYTYSWKTDRMWRKNRSRINRHCNGVDLNRNFDCAWSENPHDEPCHLNFRGPNPFSENESKAIRDYLMPLKFFIKGYISLHSYGQQIRFYWNLPEPITDVKRVLQIAEIGVQKMNQIDRENYYVRPTPKKSIYGSSRDWARKTLDVKYAYVIELRDRGQYGFLLPASKIINTAKEALEFVTTVAWAIHDDHEIDNYKKAVRTQILMRERSEKIKKDSLKPKIPADVQRLVYQH